MNNLEFGKKIIREYDKYIIFEEDNKRVTGISYKKMLVKPTGLVKLLKDAGWDVFLRCHHFNQLGFQYEKSEN